MASRPGMIRTTIALGIALTLGAPLTASAQAGGGAGPAPANRAEALTGAAAQGGGRGRGGPPPYTPAAGARDLRSVLYNWGWHLGMLRSDQERDIVASLEYQGKGTMQVGGQPCNVTSIAAASTTRRRVSGFRSPALGPMDRVVPRSKSSVGRTRGTKISLGRSSSREKAKRLRWRQRPVSG